MLDRNLLWKKSNQNIRQFSLVPKLWRSKVHNYFWIFNELLGSISYRAGCSGSEGLPKFADAVMRYMQAMHSWSATTERYWSHCSILDHVARLSLSLLTLALTHRSLPSVRDRSGAASVSVLWAVWPNQGSTTQGENSDTIDLISQSTPSWKFHTGRQAISNMNRINNGFIEISHHFPREWTCCSKDCNWPAAHQRLRPCSRNHGLQTQTVAFGCFQEHKDLTEFNRTLLTQMHFRPRLTDTGTDKKTLATRFFTLIHRKQLTTKRMLICSHHTNNLHVESMWSPRKKWALDQANIWLE